MHKPDKLTTERNAKILRELVKQPDNKLCADCKRNDPRWASWNLGVYLCIRCSGIHRGMGTHISRVKSIDLDMWTPEQMESIQKWGNRRANIYWEAHLKAGHIPPDHKMESFIRSKYESRRWAMDGPPPSDPSILDGPTESSSNGDPAPAPTPLFDTSPARSTHAPTASLSAPRPASPSIHSPSTFRQNTAHASRQLLSAAVAERTPVTVPVASLPQPQAQQHKPSDDDLFSLDFHAPPISKPTATLPHPPAKDIKQDILSLFSAPAPTAVTAAAVPTNAFGQFASSAPPSSWDVHTSRASAGASGLWSTVPDTTSSGSASIWGAPATSATNAFNGLNTTDIWGSAGASGGLFATQSTAGASKKDDVFGDLWGDFK